MSETKTRLSDYLDPHNIEHRDACKSFCISGRIPRDFIENHIVKKGLIVDIMWESKFVIKMGTAWMYSQNSSIDI